MNRKKWRGRQINGIGELKKIEIKRGRVMCCAHGTLGRVTQIRRTPILVTSFVAKRKEMMICKAPRWRIVILYKIKLYKSHSQFYTRSACL